MWPKAYGHDSSQRFQMRRRLLTSSGISDSVLNVDLTTAFLHRRPLSIYGSSASPSSGSTKMQ